MVQSVEDFRFAFQGKQLSQIIAYIWLWADGNNPQKAKNALELRSYFVNPNGGNLDLKNVDLGNQEKQVLFLKEAFARRDYDNINERLVKLLNADPRSLLENPDSNPECKKEALLLIEVFGEERIKDKSKYLSPMFTCDELGLGPQGNKVPHYEFRIDPSTFAGYLRDPDLQRPTSFQYYLAFPPRPEIGGVTVTKEELEAWVNDGNNDVIFPNSIYIPVSTS